MLVCCHYDIHSQRYAIEIDTEGGKKRKKKKMVTVSGANLLAIGKGNGTLTLLTTPQMQFDREITRFFGGPKNSPPKARESFQEEEDARTVAAVLKQNLRMGVITQEEYGGAPQRGAPRGVLHEGITLSVPYLYADVRSSLMVLLPHSKGTS